MEIYESYLNAKGAIKIANNDAITSLVELHIPESFSGSIIVKNCPNFQSLKGCPRVIDRFLTLENLPRLTSLKDGPDVVKLKLYIEKTAISSFDKEITIENEVRIVWSPVSDMSKCKLAKDSELWLIGSKMTSLLSINFPTRMKRVYLSWNDRLTSSEGLPLYVETLFYLERNIKSMSYLPYHVEEELSFNADHLFSEAMLYSLHSTAKPIYTLFNFDFAAWRDAPQHVQEEEIRKYISHYSRSIFSTKPFPGPAGEVHTPDESADELIEMLRQYRYKGEEYFLPFAKYRK